MTNKIMSTLVVLVSLLFANVAFGQDQKAIDDKILTEYFAKNNIKAIKTPSGLYYRIIKKGEGDNAKIGQKVSMLYLGRFLDGKRFDGNIDENFQPVAGRQPFAFALGQHQVIAGWDEGVQLLNKGTRATLYLPSSIAYGQAGVGPIPPNSVLMFDVEVVSIDGN